MYLSVHLLLTLLLCAVLYPFIGAGVALIFVGGLIVDADHYIAFAAKFRTLDPKKCYKFYMEKYSKNESYLFIFHTLEFQMLVLILGVFYRPLLFLLAGMLFHIFLDVVGESRFRKKWKRKFSLVYRLVSK
jgi:hypothetical protein